MMKTVIYSIGHNTNINFPQRRYIIPILAGANRFSGKGKKASHYLAFDDEGENISRLNPSFCELTALFWAWKHRYQNIKIIGFCHYRRYFGRFFSDHHRYGIFHKLIPWAFLVKPKLLEKQLRTSDVILGFPNKSLGYTVEFYFSSVILENDIKALRQSIIVICPEYLPDLNKLLKSKALSPANMFVTRWELFDSYCEWLFKILFDLQEKIDPSSRLGNGQRVFGYISELLLNVYVNHHNLKIFYSHIWKIEHHI